MVRSESNQDAGNPGKAPDPIEDFPLPVVDVDTQGVIVRANRAACILYQAEPGALIGHTLWDYMAQDEIKSSQSAFFELIRSGGEPPTIRRTFQSRQGVFRTCDVYRCFLQGPDGERVGLRATYVDVTETVNRLEEHLHAHHWLKSLMASISEAVVAVDVLGYITYINPAAERLIGWTAQELDGKPIEATLPLLDQESGDQAIIALERALDRRMKADTVMLDSEGRQLPIEISSSPIIDKESGSITGIISVIRRIGP